MASKGVGVEQRYLEVAGQEGELRELGIAALPALVDDSCVVEGYLRILGHLECPEFLLPNF